MQQDSYQYALGVEDLTRYWGGGGIATNTAKET